MTATRTGAEYVGFEGTYCPEDEGGCGQLLRVEEHEAATIEEAAQGSCPNCGFRPLAHVRVTSADAIAPGRGHTEVEEDP